MQADLGYACRARRKSESDWEREMFPSYTSFFYRKVNPSVRKLVHSSATVHADLFIDTLHLIMCIG